MPREHADREARRRFVASMPRKVAAAGALITDEHGRVLLVEPAYKPRWEVPGGCVEAGESSPEACARELQEELGLTIAVGRLLVVEHQTLPDDKGDSVMFIYDGGVIASGSEMVLPADELRSAKFVEESELFELAPLRLARRLVAALEARREGGVVELVNGEPRG